ncbi:MAG: WecB/TagA/CpsF family glycosyltransferase [Magnetococcales bacterium]|nr:WecB/TagA/CpsF family glycosyltransferase [Magnetococcales bacterium]
MLGSEFFPWTMAQTLAEIERRLAKGTFVQHAVINVAKLVQMRSNPGLRSAVNGCNIINVDGMGVVWGARFLGIPVPERVAGIDLFLALVAQATTTGRKIYLLGARPEVIERTVAVLREKHPSLPLAGYQHGYFWHDEVGVVKAIQNSGAELLFVAISSPKKEIFIHRWQKTLGVKFVMGVGGSFDVVAGVTRRAPLWLQKLGFEWLFRLLQEPRRMWKRYLVTNAIFAWLLIREKISKIKAVS